MTLEKEFKYFVDNQAKLVKKYRNKYIVIKGQEVIGVYDTEMEAYEKTQIEHELGTFLIQTCLPGEDSYSQTFHSRVIFNK